MWELICVNVAVCSVDRVKVQMAGHSSKKGILESVVLSMHLARPKRISKVEHSMQCSADVDFELNSN